MNRTKSILAAGTLTALVLITLLALGFGNLQAKSADTAVAPAAGEVQLPQTMDQTSGMTPEQAVQAWQDYSAQLEQTVRTMQTRETTYQQQLDAANQTILQMQDQINSINSAPAPFFSEEHEHGEHEEHDD
jgi:predicted  nucleic acid-binding Zn-ribbon protein